MIKQKYTELCRKLKLDLTYDGNSLSNLELRLLSAEELWDTDFISKDISNLLFNVCDCRNKPEYVNEFFESDCKDLIAGPIVNIPNAVNPNTTLADNIFMIKLNAVQRVLENRLYFFLKDTKDEMEKQNNKNENTGNTQSNNDDLPL